MSDIVLEQAGAGRISECIEVFKGSSIWEHYFSEDDRLLRSLTKAAERGELWCAVNTDGSIAGAMRVVPVCITICPSLAHLLQPEEPE